MATVTDTDAQAAAGPLILAVNSGSSSLKFGLYRNQAGEETPVLTGGVSGIGPSGGRLQIKEGGASSGGKVLTQAQDAFATPEHALGKALDALADHAGERPAAVGHRIVHGGPHLREHQPITPQVLQTLEQAVHFAPLHIPPALALIRATEKLLPGAAQFACFDTAFHSTLPESSARFALPQALYEKGVQRYGFHGLSCESIMHRLGAGAPARLVIAHLGNGASITAVKDGRSHDTSMGLTPTGGIPMGTRSGDLDPGVLLFLMRTEKMDADALESLLNRESGLKALSGGVSDMQAIEQASQQGDANAILALEVFTVAVRKWVGAYAAEMGGLDLLVFTGGIGENSAVVRERVCAGLAFLGVRPGAGGNVSVLTSEEELQIARRCRKLMSGG